LFVDGTARHKSSTLKWSDIDGDEDRTAERENQRICIVLPDGLTSPTDNRA
jgi:hypothetical protein